MKRKIISILVGIMLLFLLFISFVFAVKSHEPIYEQIQRKYPIFEYYEIEIPKVHHKGNNTWSEAYTYTYKVQTGYGYKYINGKKKGHKVNGKDYLGWNNVKEDLFVEWTVPIGDRNFVLFPGCRDYEKEKGVCKEKHLNSLEAGK